jgi:ligand-binding sensor domain-containing protein
LFCFLSLKGQDNLASKFVGITNTPINDILIERDNNFLIATGNGLYRLQDFDIDAELINNKGIYKLGADQNNLTWLGLYDSQVSSLKKGETFFIGIDENNMITAMLIHENNVWIGTNDGLYMLSLRKVKEMPHYLRENSKLLSNQITALEIDDKGKIWIGTNRGISIFDGKKWEIELENKEVSAIKRNGSEMWVAVDKTIQKMNKDKQWRSIAMPLNYSNHIIRDLAFDFNGNLWIATNHVLKYDTESNIFSVYDGNTGFYSTMALCVMVDNRNQIWVGTAGNGLYKIKNTLIETPFAAENEEDKMAFAGSNRTTIKSTEEEMTICQKEDVPKRKQIWDKKTEETEVLKSSMITNNPSKIKNETKAEKSNINFLGNRLIKEGVEVEVTSMNIEIAIWDGQNADGDSVSLYYNGECILDKFNLTKERQYFRLEINPRIMNNLVLYAHSQGDLGYTTATIAVEGSNEVTKWIVLNSDIKKCDKISFNLVY